MQLLNQGPRWRRNVIEVLEGALQKAKEEGARSEDPPRPVPVQAFFYAVRGMTQSLARSQLLTAVAGGIVAVSLAVVGALQNSLLLLGCGILTAAFCWAVLREAVRTHRETLFYGLIESKLAGAKSLEETMGILDAARENEPAKDTD
jgi:hypothetical protein